MICPDHQIEMVPSPYSESEWCSKCRHYWSWESMNVPRMVWLRSNHLSYSAEMPRRHLGLKGQLLTRPDLMGFVWEPWP